MTATIKSIARLAGVSASTVSLVLNGKDAGRVCARTRARVLRMVARQRYRRRNVARGLKLGKTFKVGLCFMGGLERNPIIGHYSSYEIVRFAACSLREAGYGVDLLQADAALALPEIARRLADEELDGLLLVNWVPAAQTRVLSTLGELGMPAVSASVIGPADESVCWAAIDNPASVRAALQHLLDTGARHVAMLEGDSALPLNAFKRSAFESFMREHSLPARLLSIQPPLSCSTVGRAVRDMLLERPGLDAVLLTDNFLAPMAQRALDGSPVRLMGFGDEGFSETLCHPPIPYMRMPVRALAESAVELLLERMRDARAPPRHRLLVCELTCADAAEVGTFRAKGAQDAG